MALGKFGNNMGENFVFLKALVLFRTNLDSFLLQTKHRYDIGTETGEGISIRGIEE